MVAETRYGRLLGAQEDRRRLPSKSPIQNHVARPISAPNDLCGRAQGQRGRAVPTLQMSRSHLLLSARPHLSGCHYQFYSLNAARCLKYSDILQWEHKNTASLQKFTAAVYQTPRSRYEKINYPQGVYRRGPSRTVRSRYDAGPCCLSITDHFPGRRTWVA
jgi:hypothetical protein